MQISSYNNPSYIVIILICFIFMIFLVPVSSSHAENNEILKVGFSFYSPPIYLSENDGISVHGLSVDIVRLLEKNINFDLQLYAMDDLNYVEALEKGIVDFFIGIKDDFESLETVNLIETDILVERHFFVNSECVTFSSLQDLPGHTVILRGGNFASRLLTSRSDVLFIEPKTEEEGLALLDSGKAQVYISHSSLLDLNAIKKRGFNNIREAGKPLINSPLIIASDKKKLKFNASLRRAYEQVTASSDYKRILNVWMNRDLNLLSFDENQNYMIFFMRAFVKNIKILIGIVVSFFSVFIFWNNMLKRKVNKVKKDLYQSEKRYKDLIESSPDMIHLVSFDGRIKLSNKMALNCLGYNKDEMLSLKLHDLVIPGDVEKATVFLDQVFKNNYSKSEFIFLTKGGSGTNVEMVATIVKWGTNNEGLACTFSRDLTERKRLEENLIHSDRQAVMGQMAAGIAHEINNPLSIILTHAGELIDHELSTDDAKESIKSIERNALRSAKTIEDLLSFTRPSPLNKAPIYIIQLIDESLLFLKHKIKNKNIKIKKNYHESHLVFLGDERMMQQLLINLILNSIQAVRYEGNIIINAVMTNETGENNVLLKIKDDGVGIHNDDMQKIFNPFYTSRKEEGFGLGLYISKIIVEKHNGSIFLESELNKGTVVTVMFPSIG